MIAEFGSHLHFIDLTKYIWNEIEIQWHAVGCKNDEFLKEIRCIWIETLHDDHSKQTSLFKTQAWYSQK